MAYRHTKGLPYVMPDNDLSYAGNFMNMLWKMAEPKYKPNPILERALDVLFILHADHEQNCSANAMRSVGEFRGRSLLHRGRGHRGAVRAAARRGQRAGPAHAAADRVEGQDPAVRPGREGSQGPPDGVRPPGVQELRSPGADHQAAGRAGLRGHGKEPAPRHGHGTRADRPGGRVLRQAEAVPERGLLLRDHLRGHGLPHRLSSRSCSPSPGCPGGWPSGRS